MKVSYRDVAGWKAQGLTLTTTSDVSAKMFDSCISQLTSWQEDENGFENAMTLMVSSDPNFILGKVFNESIKLIGTGESGEKNPAIIKTLYDARRVATEQNITQREKDHVEAAILLAEGKMTAACGQWENILKQHPTDMLAIKLAHDCYFYQGNQIEMLASIERVFPHWTKDLPLYSYLYGMKAFGLCENENYGAAAETAVYGLQLNKNDAWATHANAHVYEMTGKPDEGIAFMSKTVDDWQPSQFLACHNFWHWAVYHVENNETQAALDIFDSEVEKRCQSGAMLDYVDAASLLYRLELEGVDVGRRWSPLFKVTEQQLENHILLFNDAHFAMTLLGLKDKEYFKKFQDSINAVSDLTEIDNHKITSDFGKTLIQAMRDYDDGNYDECSVSLLRIRPDLVKMGGSNAQRDVFELLLLNAAIRSKNHREDAKRLLDCRASLRRASPMVARFRQELQV